MNNEAKLTKYVKAAGCAAKLGPGDLTEALGGLSCAHENVLVGMDTSDDASVYYLDEERALVQTVDIITPVVDDPFVYGQIAAANSLSDVFAMGGEVATAMNIVGFDGCHQPRSVLKEILAGGQNKVQECGGIIIGGHTIEAPEMTYGMSVTGFVHPKKIYRNNTPRIGDVLILTKPLGMGILTTAIKADMLENSVIEKVASILATLNHKASQIMRKYDVSACTDVTGFGLFGHASEMSFNQVTIAFEMKNIPILDEARALADMGIIPAGAYNNKSYLSSKVHAKVPHKDEIILYDAQTSGGLLIAVSQNDAPKLLKHLLDEGLTYSSIIAEILPLGEKTLLYM
ncbi:selenide, water dikinase SelD [Sulfurospirillum multivorans]|uniref:Selenide, water dikinase n=2 Tax=Sulfurospirillum multivorans TaxID=66821 RepID=A0AA86DZ88_SULMK|nr:selenide, water dikinase SelD [Sulfurospirillum multivorans]AHJ14093.1 selenide, water dikinase [Sulfurospirillum multivorans DSM 12446]QEH07580.1 selenide, water dikinase [Sulfurospirillum multivorans]